MGDTSEKKKTARRRRTIVLQAEIVAEVGVGRGTDAGEGAGRDGDVHRLQRHKKEQPLRAAEPNVVPEPAQRKTCFKKRTDQIQKGRGPKN